MSAEDVNKILTAVGGWYERLMIGRASTDAPGFSMPCIMQINRDVGALSTAVKDLAAKVGPAATVAMTEADRKAIIEGLRPVIREEIAARFRDAGNVDGG